MMNEVINVQHKKFFNNMLPYLDEDVLNDNQQALEKCVEVFNELSEEL